MRSRQGMTGSRLICPLEAESGVLGGEPSLAYRLWHILAQQATGLPLEHIEEELGPANGSGSARDVLTRNKYFVEAGGAHGMVALHVQCCRGRH